MANYDKPAFTMTPGTYNMEARVAAGDLQVLSVTDATFLVPLASAVNAWASFSTGSGGDSGPQSYPISG